MPAADRFLPKAGLLWDGPVRPTTRGVRPSPRGATRCSCTWCWLGSIEPTNVVFAALAESSLVEDHTGWSICKIVRPAAGTAPSRSASEATNAPPKTQPLPTSTARSRRSTRSVVRTNLSQVGAHSVHGASGRRAVRRVRCESQAPCQMSDHQSRFRRSSRVLPLWSVGHPCFLVRVVDREGIDGGHHLLRHSFRPCPTGLGAARPPAQRGKNGLGEIGCRGSASPGGTSPPAARQAFTAIDSTVERPTATASANADRQNRQFSGSAG